MTPSDSKILFWNGKIPLKSVHFDVVDDDKDRTEQASPSPVATPSLCGVPLKYISYVISRRHLNHIPPTALGHSQSFRPFFAVFTHILTLLFSLITLAVQNATLSLLMHYSRVSLPPSRAYSAASAVLATELLKGLISLLIALIRVRPSSPQHAFALPSPLPNRLASSPLNPAVFLERCRILGKEVFR